MGKSGGRYVGETTRAVCSLSIDRLLKENNPFSEGFGRANTRVKQVRHLQRVYIICKGRGTKKLRNQDK